MTTKLNPNVIEEGSITVDKLNADVFESLKTDSGFVTEEGLADVATSGDYNDLSNKPTIPTESTVSGWGFTKNTGTYNKPSGGIPKTDLASDVQTSLGKADTALQSYTEQYKGTVTGIKINSTTKNPSNGVVDLGTVITAHQDISGKQDKLVSGTNIKTVNGTSILGSGDITISGGSSDANVSAVDTSETLDDVSGVTYVKYVAQTLTEDQKAQARTNIGALSASDQVTVDLSNYYTKEEIDGQLGDINSVLESIINGNDSKSINTGTITSASANYTLTFEYPAASTFEVMCGDFTFVVEEGLSTASALKEPGMSLGDTVSFYPSNEDDVYIYKVEIGV